MTHCDDQPKDFDKFITYTLRQCKDVMSDLHPQLNCISRYHTFVEVRCSSFMKEAVRLRRRVGPHFTPDQETCRYVHLNALCLENAVLSHCPDAERVFSRLNFRDYFLNFIVPGDDSLFDDEDLNTCQVYDFVEPIFPHSTFAPTAEQSVDELYSPTASTIAPYTKSFATATFLDHELELLKEKNHEENSVETSTWGSTTKQRKTTTKTVIDRNIAEIDRQLEEMDREINGESKEENESSTTKAQDTQSVTLTTRKMTRSTTLFPTINPRIHYTAQDLIRGRTTPRNRNRGRGKGKQEESKEREDEKKIEAIGDMMKAQKERQDEKEKEKDEEDEKKEKKEKEGNETMSTTQATTVSGKEVVITEIWTDGTTTEKPELIPKTSTLATIQPTLRTTGRTETTGSEVIIPRNSDQSKITTQRASGFVNLDEIETSTLLSQSTTIDDLDTELETSTISSSQSISPDDLDVEFIMSQEIGNDGKTFEKSFQDTVIEKPQTSTEVNMEKIVVLPTGDEEMGTTEVEREPAGEKETTTIEGDKELEDISRETSTVYIPVSAETRSQYNTETSTTKQEFTSSEKATEGVTENPIAKTTRKKLFSSDEDFEITPPNFHYSTYRIGLIPKEYQWWYYSSNFTNPYKDATSPMTTTQRSPTFRLYTTIETFLKDGVTTRRIVVKKKFTNGPNGRQTSTHPFDSTEIFIPPNHDDRFLEKVPTTTIRYKAKKNKKKTESSPTANTPLFHMQKVFVKKIRPMFERSSENRAEEESPSSPNYVDLQEHSADPIPDYEYLPEEIQLDEEDVNLNNKRTTPSTMGTSAATTTTATKIEHDFENYDQKTVVIGNDEETATIEHEKAQEKAAVRLGPMIDPNRFKSSSDSSNEPPSSDSQSKPIAAKVFVNDPGYA
ncbi:unnamed protein product, partial [Mesorhabditis belari]|uniref:Uncharacterized protein n=1 Tax=Mesorhabditis belari TaxID=2138241 RepID=A0AAF3EVE0_9BILA